MDIEIGSDYDSIKFGLTKNHIVDLLGEAHKIYKFELGQLTSINIGIIYDESGEPIFS